MRTQESPPPEKWRPSWMWGRATLTMVVSRTTMSWAVRMTKRNTDGLAEHGGGATGPARSGVDAARGARLRQLRVRALTSTFPLVR